MARRWRAAARLAVTRALGAAALGLTRGSGGEEVGGSGKRAHPKFIAHRSTEAPLLHGETRPTLFVGRRPKQRDSGEGPGGREVRRCSTNRDLKSVLISSVGRHSLARRPAWRPCDSPTPHSRLAQRHRRRRLASAHGWGSRVCVRRAGRAASLQLGHPWKPADDVQRSHAQPPCGSAVRRGRAAGRAGVLRGCASGRPGWVRACAPRRSCAQP